MKKKLFALVLALASVLALFSLTACGGDDYTPNGSGDVVTLDDGILFTVKSGFIKLKDSTSVEDYLKALQKNGEITYEGTNGDYGFFITSVNGKKAEGSGYWAFYSDLATLDGVEYSTTEWGSYSYGEKELGYANYGITEMPCVAGYTYAFVLESY